MYKKLKQILAALMMLILLTDTKTIRTGAEEGLTLCLKTVIPSLFPFLIVSAVLNKSLTETKVRFLKPIQSFCRIPEDCSHYFILGILGGYPVGAKSINDGYKAGKITKENACRLLGFCSNAGPSFIFGIIGTLFNIKGAVWALWAIHVLSAIIVGRLIPEADQDIPYGKTHAFSRVDILLQGIKTMSVICAWVIIFKIALQCIELRLPANIPETFVKILSGFIELTNGCITLHSVSNYGLRFVCAAVYIAFGGLCVSMQTFSVTRDCGMGLYFYGKAIQSIISFLLAYFLQFLFWKPEACFSLSTGYIIITVFALLLILFFIRKKKILAFRKNMRYTINRN